MALLDLCPRCQATIRAGQLVCARCGLHLDDKRLQSGALRVQPPVTAPLTQTAALGRRNKAATGLIAVLALLALTVAAGMAQPLIGTRTNASEPASVATQTSTRAALATAINVQATPTAPATQVARTPIQIPTVTRIPATPAAVEPTLAPTQAVISPSPPAPTPGTPAASTPAPQITPTRVLPTPTRATAPSPTRVPPTPTANTPRPSPTSVPPTRPVAATTRDLNGWTIGVAGVESHSVITTTNPEVRYEPRGTFWLVYIDAVNNGSSPRSVGETLDFTLTDAAGTIYLERSDRGKHAEIREFAKVFGRDYLDTQVPPRGTARTMLVFVTASESRPRTLNVRPIGPDGKVSNSAPLRIDLPQGR